MIKMSEKESSALWQAAVYVSLMLLLVFATVVLWKQVSVYLLLVLPLVYYPFQEEWEAYKRYKKKRKAKEERENS